MRQEIIRFDKRSFINPRFHPRSGTRSWNEVCQSQSLEQSQDKNRVPAR